MVVLCKFADGSNLIRMKQVKGFFYNINLCLLSVLMLMGCSPGEKTAQEIFSECSSGVVMVLNQYYYTIKMPGMMLYCTGIDENGNLQNLTGDIREIQNKKSQMFGTGFFISKDGKILTNRHVVKPQIDKSQMKGALQQILYSYAYILGLRMSEINDSINMLNSEIDDATMPYYDDYGNYIDPQQYGGADVSGLRQQMMLLENEISQLTAARDNLASIDMSEVSIDSQCSLGVAYNNTFVSSVNDFNKCVATQVSTDSNVDLAVLQLWGKAAPDNAYIFHFYGEKDGGESKWQQLLDVFSDKKEEKKAVKLQDELYMIGYNEGIKLANTSQGIQAQITSGQVSQTPDQYKIMYTVPSLPGSSGSPVLNKQGDVVAVNFAGVSNTQGFNFGIPYWQVNTFLRP